MKSIQSLSLVLLVVAITVGGCKAKVETKDESSMDSAVDKTGQAIENAGQEVSDETVEKMVESVLIAKPGFAGVTVESEPDGVIVLTGTVVSDSEKVAAQQAAEGVTGVKSVKNELTVSP